MYPEFDISRIRLLPLAERDNDLRRGFIRDVTPVHGHIHRGLRDFASAMRRARQGGASCVLLMGAHVLRAGVQRYVFDLMDQGYISGIAVNGAAAVHDFELALTGETTESVARYILDGRFGMWRETGQINDIINAGAADGLGFGESLGRAVFEGDFPFKTDSLFARGYALRIPVTVHVGIGYDIIHPHPNFDGAAAGRASQRDFLIFANLLDRLEGGCAGTFGSAVMAPEVFLKALSLVRNVAAQEGRRIANFMSLVCDLHELPEDTRRESTKGEPFYYFRPWKTLLSRTVAGGGRACYVRGRHEETIPGLWTALTRPHEKSKNGHTAAPDTERTP